MPLVRCFKANVIVLALINASLAAAAPEASDPDVAAAYYGVDDARELAASESINGFAHPSAKHRTALASSRLNRTWLQRRQAAYNASRFRTNYSRRSNYSTFARGKTPHSPLWPFGGYRRPLLGRNRTSSEHLYDFGAMQAESQQASMWNAKQMSSARQKAALGPAAHAKGMSSQSSTPMVCCEAQVAECMACRAHMPVLFYCRRNPTSPGCAEVRARASPKARAPPTAAP